MAVPSVKLNVNVLAKPTTALLVHLAHKDPRESQETKDQTVRTANQVLQALLYSAPTAREVVSLVQLVHQAAQVQSVKLEKLDALDCPVKRVTQVTTDSQAQLDHSVMPGNKDQRESQDNKVTPDKTDVVPPAFPVQRVPLDWSVHVVNPESVEKSLNQENKDHQVREVHQENQVKMVFLVLQVLLVLQVATERTPLTAHAHNVKTLALQLSKPLQP